ncbi:MAG: HAD-IA family hydrolase [Candidatus Rokubacteria bacterium]|nr:HAD-IA family hydrolase [Candidatus Rokubacteria bacterium]
MAPSPSLRRSRPLRAVIFDAGNTLLRMNYSVIAAELLARGRPVTGAAVEEAELRARVRLDRHLGPRARPDAATVASDSTESGTTQGRYLRYILEHLGITDEGEIEALARWRRGYNLPVGLWNVADPGAESALRRVKAAGLVAGVISNSNGSVRSILEATGLAAHLDLIVDSAVVGVEKPDARIFRIGLAEARVAPEEAVYVGDLYSVDVLGARGVGMEAVLLDPRGFWGERDCLQAVDLAAAVGLALHSRPPA